ncbi:glutathione S-transferase family protein [Sphingomonas montanisoli]|uniref:Glutathione S-transferase n=1 Tax=Sphingomonas montanisoli TaxID=2606412 RepID=A0A5D9C8J2_9SPHN|nr:glutathione S-transferase [Sphingomonas montanisoli]TZG27656.1 glutathione S-transferase [Sphingomonas montanisoli]
MAYQLWYWTGIPGRGEFVRVVLEAGGVAYVDCAREKGDEALVKDMAKRRPEPFAPPYLVTGDLVIAQTANILDWLGRKHGLAPKNEAGRRACAQYQLTIADMVAETHDTHHPVASGLYYQDQKKEATRRAEDFRTNRMPKFLSYFARALGKNDWLVGDRWTYADTSLFVLVDGLRFAFPKRMKAVEADLPALHDHLKRVAALPEFSDYLVSDRRLPFGKGIFRYYPELDAD